LRWVKCTGRESRTFPKILENILDYCRHPVVRAVLQHNLDDEYGNGNPEYAHYNHYLHLLDKLNIPRDTFEEYEEKAGIRLAVDLAISISASGNLPRALGYMIVNEGMTPITYSAVQKGLIKYFPKLKTQFFNMHISVDEQHVEDLYRAIAELPAEDLPEILLGIQLGERGMAVLLDEVIGVFDF
jgi:pyrroloquinoline quinone (PQQ) biosynthesis protein C